MESPWNSLEVTKLIVAVLTPLTVFLIGAWFNSRLKKIELERIKDAEDRKQELEERKLEIERKYTPHIEFSIECQFLGTRQDLTLTSITLIANNRGNVVHKFPSIRLRARGIRATESFQFWEDRHPRAKFPYKIFEAEVVPPDWNYIYVEPDVAHRITYTTLVPTDYSHLVVHAEFSYDEFTPHNVERVFIVS